jgi:hypothetical protein
MDIIAHNMNGDIVKSGDKEAFNALVSYVKTHDLSKELNYRKILTMIDENSFIDYMVFMIYNGGGSSWLYNNTRFWREKKEGALWKWMIDDVDAGFRSYDYDSFKKAINSTTFMSDLFRGLLANDTFKNKFKNRFYKHLDTTFTNANMLQLIDKLSDERREYMDLEKEKWHISQSLFDQSIDSIKVFAQKRVSIIRNMLNKL